MSLFTTAARLALAGTLTSACAGTREIQPSIPPLGPEPPPATPALPTSEAPNHTDGIVALPNSEISIENVTVYNGTDYHISYNHANLKLLAEKYGIPFSSSIDYQFSLFSQVFLSNPDSHIEAVIHDSQAVEIQIAIGDLLNTVSALTGHEPQDQVDFDFINLGSTTQVLVGIAFIQSVLGNLTVDQALGLSSRYAQAVTEAGETTVIFAFAPPVQRKPPALPTTSPLWPETA